MKRYKIIYCHGERSKPKYLTEISKSGKRNGCWIYFLDDGNKFFQTKVKNDLLNGLEKDYDYVTQKNLVQVYLKKDTQQGINIDFE